MNQDLDHFLIADLLQPFCGTYECVVSATLKQGELTQVDLLTFRDMAVLHEGNDEALNLLLLLMLFEQNNGSLCLRLDQANLELRTFRLTGQKFPVVVTEMMEGISSGRWGQLISTEADSYSPLAIERSGSQTFVYFQRSLAGTLRLREALRDMVDYDDAPLATDEKLKGIIKDVTDSQDHRLNDQQMLALALALIKSFIVVSGGPGTGKTSIVVSLLRCLVRCGMDPSQIRLIAPTGRAAQRMNESIQGSLPEDLAEVDKPLTSLKGQTIHGLLKYRPYDDRFTYCKENPLPLRAVIVDEVSMVDVALMEKLLHALPDNVRVIFLGDKDQLPSVEAGAVLADLIPEEQTVSYTAEIMELARGIIGKVQLPTPSQRIHDLTDRIVVLTKSYRSEKSILKVAKQVNAQIVKAAEDFEPLTFDLNTIPFEGLKSGAFFVESDTSSSADVHRVLDCWAISHFLRGDNGDRWRDTLQSTFRRDLNNTDDEETKRALNALFALQTRSQILTLLRRGQSGAAGINHYLSVQLRRVFDPSSHGIVFHGAPIIILRNDRSKGLFNGDVGIVLRDSSGVYRAVFRRGTVYHVFSIEGLPAFDLAYAITVHKSQGSEYERVLMVLPSDPSNRLLTKEIVYTGLTRAKKLAVILGAKSVLAQAIRRRTDRETGASVWGELEFSTIESDLSELPLFRGLDV